MRSVGMGALGCAIFGLPPVFGRLWDAVVVSLVAQFIVDIVQYRFRFPTIRLAHPIKELQKRL